MGHKGEVCRGRNNVGSGVKVELISHYKIPGTIKGQLCGPGAYRVILVHLDAVACDERGFAGGVHQQQETIGHPEGQSGH